MTKQEQAQIIREAAVQIGTRPEWLDALINFETAGTYDTMIANPNSTAKGLIQFTNAAAADLGMKDSLTLVTTYPDFASQMFNAVVPYFKMKARQNDIVSYMNKQALYMAVFYPAYWDAPLSKPFPSSVILKNPGINTPQDYIDFVDKRIHADALRVPPTVLPLLLLAGAGVAALFLLRSRRG